jgi:hypothetical protein
MENGQHPAVTQFERSNIYGIGKRVLAEIAGGQGVNISAGKGRCANNSRNGRLQRSTGLRLERGLGPLMKRRHQTTVGFNRWIEDELWVGPQAFQSHRCRNFTFLGLGWGQKLDIGGN